MAWPGPQSFAPATRADTMGAAQPKPVEHRNPALLAMARGKQCLLRVAGVCNCDPRTTVACHQNEGKGMAQKRPDYMSCWGCSACHFWYDQSGAARSEKRSTFMRAHLDQVLAWRRVVGDMTYTPKERAAAHWALCLLEATPTGETP